MKKIPKVALLYVLNWVVFVVFFSMRIFDALIFKAVSLNISHLPIPELLRSILIALWMIVPQSIILLAVNKSYLQLSPKKFLLTQVMFAVSVVLILVLVLMSARAS